MSDGMVVILGFIDGWCDTEGCLDGCSDGASLCGRAPVTTKSAKRESERSIILARANSERTKFRRIVPLTRRSCRRGFRNHLSIFRRDTRKTGVEIKYRDAVDIVHPWRAEEDEWKRCNSFYLASIIACI